MRDFVDGSAFNFEQGQRARKLFAAVVLAALDDAQPQGSNPFELLQKLHADTGTEIPPRMLALENLPVLHSEVIPADKMELAVVKNLV